MLKFRTAIMALIIGAFAPALSFAQDHIQFTGSTSMLPIITDAANAFRQKYETWNRVNPALPNAPILIYTAGGGSSAGVRSAIDGSAHVGMANRDPRPAELERLGEHTITPIGIDGIAFAAHRDSPLFTKLDNLTTEQAAKIFSGEWATFRDVHPELPNRPIVLLMRDASGGNTQIVKASVLGDDRDFSRDALQMPSTGVQLRRIQSNANAFAYISSGVIWRTDDVRAFLLEGIAPTQENLVNGTYPLQRRMNLIVRGEADPRAQAFIDFLLSPEGQAIVERHDYVPMVAASE